MGTRSIDNIQDGAVRGLAESRFRPFKAFGLAAFILFGLSWLADCRSPTSPERSITNPSVHAFGLYDDFDSGSIDSSLWYCTDMRGIEIPDDGSGNKHLEMTDNILMMQNPIYPAQLYPDGFDRMSARLRIPSGALYEDSTGYGPYLLFRVSFPERLTQWQAAIGIRRASAHSARIFGSWEEIYDGGNWETGLDAEFDKWYTLEMQFQKISATELKIIFRVDGRIFGETIPDASALLLDRERVTGGSRFLRTFDKEQGTFAGWFDDIRAVIVSPGEDMGTTLGEAPPSPLEFLNISAISGRPERFSGPVREKESASDPRVRKER
jgi:hypothetical protein